MDHQIRVNIKVWNSPYYALSVSYIYIYIEFRSHFSMPKASIAKKINHKWNTYHNERLQNGKCHYCSPKKKSFFRCFSLYRPNSFRTWDKVNYRTRNTETENKSRTEMKPKKMPAWLQMNSHTKVMMLSHSVGVYMCGGVYAHFTAIPLY